MEELLKLYKHKYHTIKHDNKYKLIAMRVSCALLVLSIEKALEEGISTYSGVAYKMGYTSDHFRKVINSEELLEFTSLETLFKTCDYIGLTISQVYKIVLKDIQVDLNVQKYKAA